MMNSIELEMQYLQCVLAVNILGQLEFSLFYSPSNRFPKRLAVWSAVYINAVQVLILAAEVAFIERRSGVLPIKEWEGNS